jgi:hypothetical protein
MDGIFGKMNAALLSEVLLRHMIETSGCDLHRDYLGMSAIGQCSARLYRRMVQGGERPSDRDLLKLRSGNVWEREVLASLRAMQVIDEARPLEVVARFDQRFRGHIDAALQGNLVLEVKSTVQADLDRLLALHTVKQHHMQQIQMYIEHGNFDGGIVLYIARDTGQFFSMNMPRIESQIAWLNEKARRVLCAVDQRQALTCDCGYCR